jgi:hypothetical protein
LAGGKVPVDDLAGEVIVLLTFDVGIAKMTFPALE